MDREYSIAEARDHFAEIVRQAEAGDEVRLTRRGRPIAVLMSERRYEGLAGGDQAWWKKLQDWRAQCVRDGVVVDADVWDGLRDESPGREVDPL